MLLFNLPWSLQPDAKLIAVLRDPVERTYSDFRFFFSCGTGPCVHRCSSFANGGRANVLSRLAFTRHFLFSLSLCPLPPAFAPAGHLGIYTTLPAHPASFPCLLSPHHLAACKANATPPAWALAPHQHLACTRLVA